MFQYKYENCQNPRSQKHSQTARRSELLVSGSLLGAQRNSMKRPSQFICLKTPVHHRNLGGCVLELKKRNAVIRRKVSNNKQENKSKKAKSSS